jgi:hypothetical protein
MLLMIGLILQLLLQGGAGAEARLGPLTSEQW